MTARTARKVAAAVSKVFTSVNLGNQAYVSRINTQGVRVIES